MDTIKLEQEKKQLEQTREQLIAQVNQVTGAIAFIDKVLAEDKPKEEEDKDTKTKK